MIWPDTSGLGCAVGRNTDRVVTVCEYVPQGNILGVSIDVRIGATRLVRR
jgi:hypothetical protein